MQTTKSRNKREGRYCGKFLRRHRRNGFFSYSRLSGGCKASDWIATRAERRADKLERSQIARGVLPQPEEVDCHF